MDFRLTLRIVGSLRFAAVILVLLCIAMACATVFEATHGTPAALEVFYKSDWFKALLGLLGLNVLASMLSRLPWSRRHVGFLITHASILIILLGAWITEIWGINGQVAITEGQSARQFTTDRHAIVVRKADQDTFASAPLGRGIGGRDAIANCSSSPLQAGGLSVEVQSYVPDSEWTQRVVDDNPEPSLALEVSLASQGQTSKEWIFADSRQRSNVAVRAVATPAELDGFLAGPATRPAAAVRTVKVELGGNSFAFPLEQCMEAPVAIGDTGYTLKVLRYLPHAMVGENRQLSNASDRPVNPAIEAEISGPEGSTKRTAFARFPDFGSMHGAQTPAAEAKLSLDVPAEEKAASLIEVAAGPGGRLVARFNPADGAPVTREIQLNQVVETPWPGLTLLVARRFDRARRESLLEPVADPRQNRVPAISVVARVGEHSRELWLRRQEPQRIEMGSERYELTYGSEILPLGFEIRLNKFHLGTYPGTGRPRSFESHVTFIDGAGSEEPRKISMNNPAVFGSYSLFQSSYEQPRSGPSTTILSVSWDPGLRIVFGGYVTLVLGMIYVLVTRMRARKPVDSGSESGAGESERASQSSRPVEKGPSLRPQSQTARAGGLAAIALAAVLASQPTDAVAQSAKLPAKVDVGLIRGLPVQHDGRWMPLDTAALDVVRGVTGSKYFQGQDAVRWLLAWTFEPATWQERPLITISPAELRRELQLPEQRSVFSFGDLVRHRPLMDQIDQL